MAGTDAIPDRVRLQQRAAARTRRARRTATTVALTIFGLIVTLAIVVAAPESWSSSKIAQLLIPTAIGTAVLVVGFRWLSRQHTPQLMDGASQHDQRAVERALRTDRASDARIDALARETAQHERSRPWLPWLLAVPAVVQVGLVVLGAAERDWSQIALPALSFVAWCLILRQIGLRQRRNRRYLRTAVPPRGEEPATIAASAVSWIELTREPDVGAIAHRMTFHVDGRPVARLRRGDTARIEVTPGLHVVQARMDWLRSPPLQVNVGDDASTAVTGGLTEHSTTFTGMFLQPRNALQLHIT